MMKKFHFPYDAIDGENTGLSWTKMKYEQNMQMPRTIVNKDYAQFSICTKIGALGSVSDVQMHPNAFDKELGIGITVYFKMLRYFGLMFLLFAALSLPTYIICATNGETNSSSSKTGVGNLISTFSIGNVGESSL